jgi:murein DD-endopeptidase MepM/ murein hydrolase activator NlpD
MAKRSKLSILLGLITVVVLAGGGYSLFQDTTSPDIQISHTAEIISPTLPVTVSVTDAASAIKQLHVAVRYQENEIPIAREEYSDGGKTQRLTFTLADAGLKNGDTFDMEITAVDNSLGGFGFGNKKQVIFPLRLDTQPPRLSVKSSMPYVRRGGSACVVYSISKEVQQTGVRVNDLFFPSFRQENGDYICFFAFPYTLEPKDYSPHLVALDNAGNMQSNSLPVTGINRQFKTDTLAISRGFLDAKAVEFAGIVPGVMTDIERFLVINSQVRKQNAATLMDIGKKTASRALWKGAFLRLPRASSRAGFADHRTYMWEGQKVDEQTHLGFDLASLKQASVPAANSGVVVYSGYLGLYGNLVIIDHGLGLQSLYSHLSEISVETGQQVEKGQIIGKTGTTGMAGGDHLHFGILISGLEVTPLEWLDDHWIKDNIVDRIKDAGGSPPAFDAVSSPPPASPAVKKPARKK